MNLFSKSSSYLVISIGKFSNQLYIITQSKKAINSWCLFQRLNPSKVILRINTYRAEISCYTLKRVVKANCNESIVRPSEVCLTLVNKKCKVYVIPKVKDYATSVVYKDSLINFSSISNPTLVVNKYSDIIPSKFKVVKFTLE